MAPRGKDQAKLRIAILHRELCRPKKCQLECKVHCPVNQRGQHCIIVDKNKSQYAQLEEGLCIGCGICVNQCPFKALQIINLPKDMGSQVVHRYLPNGFKLHMLPLPRLGKILGLIGTNGTGKSTALKVLGEKIRPNLGLSPDPEWDTVVKFFKGSELMTYMKKLGCGEIKSCTKIQYVDDLPKVLKGTVKELLDKSNQWGSKFPFFDCVLFIAKLLYLDHLLERNIPNLSGGELQRLALAAVFLRDCTLYMIDEPSSYLDIKQRFAVAKLVRGLAHGFDYLRHDNYNVALECISEDWHEENIQKKHQYESDREKRKVGLNEKQLLVVETKAQLPPQIETDVSGDERYVIVVEHDLSVLDYMSDNVSCIWGKPGAYGAICKPQSVAEGINVYLSGYVPTENLRFRDYPLSFNIQTADSQVTESSTKTTYPTLTKEHPGFKLVAEAGVYSSSECVILVGENGTGKSTFINMLQEHFSAKDLGGGKKLVVSVKPQKISPKFPGSVEDLLKTRILSSLNNPLFQTDVVKPMNISELMSRKVQELSGGELQRVAIVLALGKPADIYLLDEPSAYLDVEQRVHAARVIKRFVYNTKRSAFIVEHDFVLCSYLADRVICFSGEPGKSCVASQPLEAIAGLNRFLKELGITFRRDPENGRPRINKPGSQLDMEQKASGNYLSNC